MCTPSCLNPRAWRAAVGPLLVTVIALAWLGPLLVSATAAGADTTGRALLVRALLAEGDEQTALVAQLAASTHPLVERALAAWRGGELFLHDAGDGRKIPFLLDPQTDADGKARAVQLADGEPLKDAAGAALTFAASELTPVDTSRSLRRAIKQALDLIGLSHPDPKSRRDAASRLGFEQNAEYLPAFEARLRTETVPAVRKALEEARAITQLASEDLQARAAGAQRLGELRSISGLTLLKQLQADARANPGVLDEAGARAVQGAIAAIENYLMWGNIAGTVFRGLSLGAVLLMAALGLAITFGLMGVINMAHGEMIMVGAYAAYVVQSFFKEHFATAGFGFDAYFPVALVAAFLSAAGLGIVLERGIIRFLYARPLESLLATWGVSLILQQTFRRIFGAANVHVASPSWLSGTYTVCDVLFAYNRLFVIGFAVLTVLGTYWLLTRTGVGLQVRAVMQNRGMAACMGVRTDRVNLITFAFGSGLAGMAGACLAQIGNVGPSLGQSYIVDCFMVVVLGGVGNLAGTIWASLGIGSVDQILQPYLGAVMGKISVLVAIILFLQWRPGGLFVTRSRSLEG